MIANPPPWPNGARCAVAFSFDVDADSVVHAAHRGGALDEQHAIAHMRYDPFVALPRLARLFSDREVPVTWFVPGWVIETYRAELDVIVSERNEIGHHGHFHEWPNRQSWAEEQEALNLGIERIVGLTGAPPVGYRAPYYGLSRNTFDLLAGSGFTYDSSLFADDVPILLQTQKGPLVELPIPAGVDDYNQYVSSRAFDYLMKVSAPSAALQVYREEFDALWQFGGLWVGVWHPAVSGRPAQSLAIAKLIDHMRARGDVWFASLGEIAAHTNRLIAEGVWSPRVEKVPFYDRHVLD